MGSLKEGDVVNKAANSIKDGIDAGTNTRSDVQALLAEAKDYSDSTYLDVLKDIVESAELLYAQREELLYILKTINKTG
jgi:hypothetical protein